MIQYLKHSEIDKTKWDLCIEQSSNSLVYGYSWYLDIVAPHWEALVLGDYVAVMPLTRNTKLFISYLYQPFFTQQLGVFSQASIESFSLASFIDSIPSKFKFIDINLNAENEIIEKNYKLKKRKNFVLDLNKPYEQIHKLYDEHCKRNLKKTKKTPQSILAIDVALAVAFYQKYKSEQTRDVTSADYENLILLLLAVQEKGMLLPRGVYNQENELLAIGVYVLHKGRIIYLLGGSSEKGRESRAMYYLFDDLIHNFSGHPMLLDFEGSEISGIARFFKGFGAQKKPYYKLYLNRLPLPLRWLK